MRFSMCEFVGGGLCRGVVVWKVFVCMNACVCAVSTILRMNICLSIYTRYIYNVCVCGLVCMSSFRQEEY